MGEQLIYEGARWFVWGLVGWWVLISVLLIGYYIKEVKPWKR